MRTPHNNSNEYISSRCAYIYSDYCILKINWPY